jgi:preprotein translocase subunit YajC
MYKKINLAWAAIDLLLLLLLVSIIIIHKLNLIMEDVKSFKDQLATNNQLLQAANIKLSDAALSLVGIKGDVKALKDKIIGVPPEDDGSVRISKEDWAEIKGLADNSTTSVAALADQVTSVSASAKEIDDETPAEETAPVTGN